MNEWTWMVDRANGLIQLVREGEAWAMTVPHPDLWVEAAVRLWTLATA